jgi:copper chaperone NosL
VKKNSIKTITRVLLALCAGALVIVLFVPMWRIDLVAPQYPEGLKLLISPHGLGGNVDIINGLNHYIGMKTLHTADFMEFTILPYIIIFFSLLLLVTAITGSRRLFSISVILFILFGIIAMVDFWKWEYNYGHHLNPDAAIIVPGMAYQPPLIGYKQLLNFSAYSIPDLGGWLFLGVGVMLMVLLITEWLRGRKVKRLRPSAFFVLLPCLLMLSCNKGPSSIVVGRDHCDFCKMTVSDKRFGAEVLTKKGKAFKFDDAHCMLSFLESKTVAADQVNNIYLVDFSGDHSLVKAETAFLLKSDALRSPMAGNVAAFSNKDSLDMANATYKGNIIRWADLYHP